MVATLIMSSFDLPSHSSSGFLVRYIAPRLGPLALYGPLARRIPFSFAAPNSDIIIGTGHGEPDEYTAQNETVIWKANNLDKSEVEGKVICLLSCDSGAILGPALVRTGARAFWGYDDDLLWIADEQYYHYPWRDPNARAAMMPIVDGLNALLDGSTAEEAYRIQVRQFSKNAGMEEHELSRSCLEFDAKHSVLLGDRSARVSARPRFTMPFPPPPLIF